VKKFITAVTLIFATLFVSSANLCAQDQKVAGTFFGDPVSHDNYQFVLRIVVSFHSPWGGIPRTRKQAEKRVWEDLVLSYESHRRKISVSRKELDEKIDQTVRGDGAKFDWKQDNESYKAWVREKLNISAEGFENQMRHLAQVKKLQEQVINSIHPSVTDEEALQEFYNEHNSLSVELAEFDEFEKAQEFYEQIKSDPDVWRQTVKTDNQLPYEDRSFRRPGFVALEFLMDMWKFPKKAVYDMIKSQKGDFYPPTPIYEGYGVFKILDIRLADESNYPQRKESYFEQLRMRKKHKGFRDWLKKLQDDADMQVFSEVPPELFP